jgi:hypothetical protein
MVKVIITVDLEGRDAAIATSQAMVKILMSIPTEAMMIQCYSINHTRGFTLFVVGHIIPASIISYHM